MNNIRDFDRLYRDMRGKSPLRASLLLLLIIAFLLSAGVWAWNTELDDVTRGDGRIVPTGNIQIIQAAETGVLQALHVREGEVVEQDDLLMELDRTIVASQLDQEQQRAAALRARILRLQTFIDGKDALIFPDQIVQHTPEVAKSETALFMARQREIADEIQVYERQRSQRQQEYEEGQVDAQTARETLALVDEEIEILRPLVERRVEPEIRLLGLRRSRAEWSGRVVRAKAALVRLRAALEEVDDRIRAYRARTEAEALSELAIATAELAELETRLPALQERVARSDLRASMRGIVNQIHLTTLGGLAKAGDPLIEIVPLDDTVLVEAYIRPSDIAFLYPGQPVRVKITAYDFTRYGALNGEIIRIGADAVTREDRDEQAFVVQIRTSTNILDADGAALEVVPGMVAQVDILAGKKTIAEYLKKPIVRVRERAFQE